MTTIRKLAKGALRLINVISTNEEPTADDMDITLKALNGLMDSLGNDLLNIYTFTPYRFLLTPQVYEYKLGPEFDAAGNPTGADWVTKRPMRIEQVKLMLFSNIGIAQQGDDYNGITAGPQTLFLPIQSVSDEEYASICVRALPNQWPTVMYDSGSFPTRTLRFWPVPQQTNAVELWLWSPLLDYANLDEEINLPPGYERYLRFKLAVEVAAEFGKVVQNTVMNGMIQAEGNIKSLNQQLPRGYPSQMGNALQGKGRGSFYYIDNLGSYALPRSW